MGSVQQAHEDFGRHTSIGQLAAATGIVQSPSGRGQRQDERTKVRRFQADQGTSVPVTLDQSEGMCLLRLEGEIKIASAAELKKFLQQALETRAELRVDLEHATDVDVTALQLLWAAGREARASGTGFRLVGSVPKEVLMAANETGFESFPVGLNPE